MCKLYSGATGREAADLSDDPIAALPPFVSKKRTGEVLCINRATVWRRIKDGTLEVASGSGKVTKASIQRFVRPRGQTDDAA